MQNDVEIRDLGQGTWLLEQYRQFLGGLNPEVDMECAEVCERVCSAPFCFSSALMDIERLAQQHLGVTPTWSPWEIPTVGQVIAFLELVVECHQSQAA